MTQPVITAADIAWATFTVCLAFAELWAARARERYGQPHLPGGAA